MYDSYIMRRTQIYLDDDQDDKLARRAAGAGVTKSMLIRQAIDAFLDDLADSGIRLARFRAALDELQQRPVAFESGASYVERLRAQDRRRQEQLERRRR
jgi:predicted transcriptional regulator